MDCDVLVLGLSEPSQGEFKGAGDGQGGYKHVEPYFLEVVHHVGAACLATEEK